MFIPKSPEATRRLDQAMREDLAESLGRLGVMAAAVLPEDAGMELALEHIRDHQVLPGVFARYYDLVFALKGQAHARAAVLWREIAQHAGETAELAVVPFDLLGEDCERFDRLVALADGSVQVFAPPPAAEWRRFEPRAGEALALLARIDPAWSAEVRALVTRVIAAVPPEGASRRFAGASNFMIWGAIFTNIAMERDRIRVLASLVHEATHQLLFGLSRREPLVANPIGDRFASPLRRDPRPMDGVFHATYVVARLARLYEILANATGELTADEAADAHSRIAGARAKFQQGRAVILKDAQLTPLGRRLIEEATDHVMAAA